MRPRVFPAEDASAAFDATGGDVDASMRPRVFPAEDGGLPGAQGRDQFPLQ